MTKMICKGSGGMEVEIDSEELSFRPSVYGVIIENAKVLLIKYKDGIYDIPGGGIDKGEKIKGALKREIFEEVGLKFNGEKIIECTENFFKTRTHGYTHSVRIHYLLSGITGVPNLDNLDEYEKEYVTSVEWIDVNKLDSLSFHKGANKVEIIKMAVKM